METDSSTVGIVPVVDTAPAMIPTTTRPIATIPPLFTVTVLSTSFAPAVPMLPTYGKVFPDISRIKVFFGQNFKSWQERIYSTLDMHGEAWLLSTENMHVNTEVWAQANKVCRHTILTTLSNELFDVYYAYKEAKVIWKSMLTKYMAEDEAKVCGRKLLQVGDGRQ